MSLAGLSEGRLHHAVQPVGPAADEMWQWPEGALCPQETLTMKAAPIRAANRHVEGPRLVEGVF